MDAREFSRVVDQSRVVDWPTLLELRARWRKEGRAVVWTNGCFDILHVGHLHSLRAARGFGDLLVVGVNSDSSVRQFKGQTRPIFSDVERAELLSGFACVDYVVIFDEVTPEAALARLQPDIHCKGADYAPPHGKPIPEAAVVQAYGGRVEFLPLIPDVSTSAALLRMGERGA